MIISRKKPTDGAMKKIRKIRPEENALLIWSLNQGRTAYFSGEELVALKRWTTGEDSGFINRLKKLEIVEDEDKQAIAKAIELSKVRKAPGNSFYSPESLHVELTECCPLNCPQCYKGRESPKILEFSVLQSVILQADAMQVFQFALGGGEPLTYPYLYQAIKEINQCGMASTITTSGYGLDRSVLNKLTQSGLNHIQVSVNGSCKEIHSKSREGYEHAINALTLLRDSKMSFGVNWVARRDNIEDFPAFIEKARGYKVNNINVLRYKPSGNEVYKEHYLPADKATSLAETIRNTRGIRIKTDSAFSNLLCHLNQRVSFMAGCGAGRRFLALDAEGNYRPCSHVSTKEKAEHLQQTWLHSENLKRFRTIANHVGEPCASCDYLHGCYGCRAVVLEQGGDFFDGDRECFLSYGL